MAFIKGVSALTVHELKRITVLLVILAVVSFGTATLTFYELATRSNEADEANQVALSGAETIRGAAGVPLLLLGAAAAILALLAWRRAAKLTPKVASAKRTNP